MKFKKCLTLALLGVCLGTGLIACTSEPPLSECEKNGHTFDHFIGESTATCTEGGFQLVECTVCYELDEIQVPALGHKEQVEPGYEATCTKDGKTDKIVCEICKEVLTPSSIIPKGHVVGDVRYISLPVQEMNYKGYVEFNCGREDCKNWLGNKNMYTDAKYTNGQIPLPAITDPAYSIEVDGEETHYTISILEKTVEFTLSNYYFNYFNTNEAKLHSYKGTTANLIMPQTYENLPITQIGENAFKNNVTLETIVLPNTIKTISASAFEGCTSLKSIVLPEGCTIINQKAFKGCTSLTSVTIPSTVEYIYNEAFKNCSLLEEITLPENLDTIGEYAFEGCQTLETVTVPANTTLQNYAFRNCTSLETVTISKNSYSTAILMGCNNIKNLTVQNATHDICSLFTNRQSYEPNEVVPASLKEITIVGSNSYYQTVSGYEGLQNIEKVTILNCDSIDYNAFTDCTSLTTVIIPNNIKDISPNAFNGCTALVTTNSNNGLYLGNENNPYLALIGHVKPQTDCEFTVNENTKIMAISHPFWTDFTAYNIHNGIERINYDGSESINATINYDGTVGKWFIINDTQINYGLSNITFGDGTKKQDITHLVLDEGTEILTKNQLNGYNLTAITLPVSLYYIEYSTFNNIDTLKTIYYNGEYEEWNSHLADEHNEIYKGIEHVYFFNGTEYYEPTYARYYDSIHNVQCFNKLEKLIISKNVNLYTNASNFDSLIGKIDIYYLGGVNNWASYGNKKTQLEAKFNVYCYSETEQSISDYFNNPVKLWHYDENGEPTPWIEVGKTVVGKTYNYTTTTVEITNEYWSMLQQLKDSGMLNQAGLTQEDINMITSSNTKAEYEQKLANFSKLVGSNMTISFAGGVMTVKKDGTISTNYYEINGKIYVRSLGKYNVYATIQGNTIIEESIDEYTTVRHVWTVA